MRIDTYTKRLPEFVFEQGFRFELAEGAPEYDTFLRLTKVKGARITEVSPGVFEQVVSGGIP